MTTELATLSTSASVSSLDSGSGGGSGGSMIGGNYVVRVGLAHGGKLLTTYQVGLVGNCRRGEFQGSTHTNTTRSSLSVVEHAGRGDNDQLSCCEAPVEPDAQFRDHLLESSAREHCLCGALAGEAATEQNCEL